MELEFTFLENLLKNSIVPEITKNIHLKDSYTLKKSDNTKLNILFNKNICTLDKIISILKDNYYTLSTNDINGNILNTVWVLLDLNTLSDFDKNYFKIKCYEYLSSYIYNNDIFTKNDHKLLRSESQLRTIIQFLFKDKNILDIFNFMYVAYDYFTKENYKASSCKYSEIVKNKSLILLKLVKYLLIETLYTGARNSGGKYELNMSFFHFQENVINYNMDSYSRNIIMVDLIGYIFYLHYKTNFNIKDANDFYLIFNSYSSNINTILCNIETSYMRNAAIKQLYENHNIVFFKRNFLISEYINLCFLQLNKIILIHLSPGRNSEIEKDIEPILTNLKYIEDLHALHNVLYHDIGHKEVNGSLLSNYVAELDTNIENIFNYRVKDLQYKANKMVNFLKYSDHKMFSLLFLRDGDNKIFHRFIKYFKEYCIHNSFGIPKNFKSWIINNKHNIAMEPLLQMFKEHGISIERTENFNNKIKKMWSCFNIAISYKNMHMSDKIETYRYHNSVNTANTIIDLLYDNGIYIPLKNIIIQLQNIKMRCMPQEESNTIIKLSSIEDIQELCEVIGFSFLKLLKIVKTDECSVK